MRRAAAGLLAALACVGAAADEIATFRSADGTAIPGYLVRPAGKVAGAVVALHGCGGLYVLQGARRGQLQARYRQMAELLIAQGYAVLFPDSFLARGENELCTQRLQGRSIGQDERRADALAAMDWLGSQPWSAGDRVALLGWSHGATAVLFATDAGDADVKAQARRPRLAVAFYPGCNAALKAGYRAASPLVLMLGGKDDWTPAAPCVELGQRVQAEANVYPEAYHGFDNAAIPTVRLRRDVPNGAHPGHGVHVGLDAAAKEASYQRLLDLLARAFE